MPKYKRNESYAKIHSDLVNGDEKGGITIVSPQERDPKKFALVSFESEENDSRAFILTFKTLNEVCQHIDSDESEFSPSYAVDLDTGKTWEPEFAVELVEGDYDYFVDPAGEEEEESEEDAEEGEEAPH